jgi:hypothetical protein
MLQAEFALMAAVLALYLYDSALLLYGDEAVVSASGRGGWSVRFGSKIQLRGKDLFLPSPLFPHRPIWRLAWRVRAGEPAGDLQWTARRALFAPLAPMIWGMAGAFFVLLPLGLFSRLGDEMVLAAVAVLYFNILALIGWLAWKRASFGVTRRRLAALAFEALVCSPFALNLVRKVSAEMPVDENLIDAARRLLRPQEWSASRAEILQRIGAELDFEEEGSPRTRALEALRAELER